MAATTRITLEPAWVLHARPYRDTSLLVEAFARDHGRVGLVARGVRSARGRWRGLLQPAQPLLLSWSGRGELGTVSGCEPAGPALPLQDEALMSAWYVNELLLRLLQRDDPHPPLFATYEETLNSLAMRPAAALRVFEKRLLDELGWGASYDQACDDGSAVVGGRRYGFIPDRGVLADAAGEIEVEGATLLAIATETFDDDAVLKEARKLMRTALEPHLGGRPLHSRELLAEWRARKRAP